MVSWWWNHIWGKESQSRWLVHVYAQYISTSAWEALAVKLYLARHVGSRTRRLSHQVPPGCDVGVLVWNLTPLYCCRDLVYNPHIISYPYSLIMALPSNVIWLRTSQTWPLQVFGEVGLGLASVLRYENATRRQVRCFVRQVYLIW